MFTKEGDKLLNKIGISYPNMKPEPIIEAEAGRQVQLIDMTSFDSLKPRWKKVISKKRDLYLAASILHRGCDKF